MRLITVIAGLFVASLLCLDLSASSHSPGADQERPVENSVHESTSTEDEHHKDPIYSNSTDQIQDRTKRNADYLSYGRGVKTQTALSALNVGNLAVLGIVVLGGLALVAPIIFPEPFRRSMARDFKDLRTSFLPMLAEERQLQKFLTSGLVGVSESIMGWVEKSVDDLPSFPRLDGQECLKRCICEAHNQPKKYGIVGLGLQLFFPPYTETDEPSRIVSKYQLAARYGRQDAANCAAQYDGCMVNFLDAIQGIFKFTKTRRF